MVTVAYSTHFEKEIRKIRDLSQKERVKAQILRIVHDPEILKTYALEPEKYAGGVHTPLPSIVLL